MGFCWYVRYNKKHERRGQGPPDEEGRPAPGQYYRDPETGENKISINNVNEESMQFIQNVYKDWKRSESMRSQCNSRHSRRDREYKDDMRSKESEESSHR